MKRPGDSEILGVIDLGSHAVRLMIVRVEEDGSFTELRQVRRAIRLGAGAFMRHRLQEDAMERTLAALADLADLCAACGVEEVAAVATAAVRDAENGQLFLADVKARTGLSFTVLSGQEEAHLAYLGVSSGLEPPEGLRLCFDIGGGSTEFAVGRSCECLELASVGIGSVRLTNLFFEGETGPVSAERYAEVRNYVRTEARPVFHRLGGYAVAEAAAGSGTVRNMAALAAALEQTSEDTPHAPRSERADTLTRSGLCRAVKELCRRTVEERRRLPGIHPDRADVILAGAAILQTIMEEQNLERVRISPRGLRYGILADRMLRREGTSGVPTASLFFPLR